MPNQLVSCIVPAFNSERYVREALDSILAQTHRPLEIIVADDGSTDGTLGIVAGYGEVVRLVTQTNAGPPATRNLGLAAARGAFVAFLDADDLWHPEKLARQLARFDARPDLDISVTHMRNFWIPELRDEAEHFRNHHLSQSVPGYLSLTLLARRALFDTVGAFDITRWHSDSTDWLLRAADRDATMELLRDVLVFRRLHYTNLSRRMGPKIREEFLRTVKASLDARRHHTDAAPDPLRFPPPELPAKI